MGLNMSVQRVYSFVFHLSLKQFIFSLVASDEKIDATDLFRCCSFSIKTKGGGGHLVSVHRYKKNTDGHLVISL